MNQLHIIRCGNITASALLRVKVDLGQTASVVTTGRSTRFRESSTCLLAECTPRTDDGMSSQRGDVDREASSTETTHCRRRRSARVRRCYVRYVWRPSKDGNGTARDSEQSTVLQFPNWSTAEISLLTNCRCEPFRNTVPKSKTWFSSLLNWNGKPRTKYWLRGSRSQPILLSASLYVSKRGAYWDRLCRDVVGRWLVGRWLSRACTVAKRCILGL